MAMGQDIYIRLGTRLWGLGYMEKQRDQGLKCTRGQSDQKKRSGFSIYPFVQTSMQDYSDRLIRQDQWFFSLKT